jgi:hypothetical protein
MTISNGRCGNARYSCQIQNSADCSTLTELKQNIYRIYIVSKAEYIWYLRQNI